MICKCNTIYIYKKLKSNKSIKMRIKNKKIKIKNLIYITNNNKVNE